jgi:SNF2 family DNA or RNA helicase
MGHRALRIDGEVPEHRRAIIVKHFNMPNTGDCVEPLARRSVLLLSAKAGGVGLNLTGRHHCI